MISGRQALATIEGAISKEQAAAAELEAKLEGLLKDEEGLRREEMDDYRELARLRLDDIAGGDIVGRLDRVEEQAVGLLAAREQARKELQSRMTRLADQVAALVAERDRQAEVVKAAQQDVADAEAKTRTQLDTNSDYVEQRETAHKIDIQASNADEKASQSESELAAKRAAYEDSALFMYLWKRHYGTTDYLAPLLIRALDGWVARLVRYEDARASYFRLQEIPRRLREHAGRLADQAEAEEARLEDLWNTARTEDGLRMMDAALETAEKSLDLVGDQLQATTTEQQEALDELGRYAAGEDELTTKAVDLVSTELQEKEMTMLFRQARETLRSEDDIIISRILDRRQSIGTLEASRRQLKDSLDRRLNRLRELSEVSREFNSRNYARANSLFRDGALIGVLLRDFLNGGLSQEALWDQIARQQSWRRTSPGPSMPSRRTITFGGGGRPGSRSVGMGGGRSSGGGGFRTGGGF